MFTLTSSTDISFDTMIFFNALESFMNTLDVLAATDYTYLHLNGDIFTINLIELMDMAGQAQK